MITSTSFYTQKNLSQSNEHFIYIRMYLTNFHPLICNIIMNANNINRFIFRYIMLQYNINITFI